MALPWPHGAPTLPVPTIRPSSPSSPSSLSSRLRSVTSRQAGSRAATRRPITRSLVAALPDVPRVRTVLESPVTALVAMVVGLTLLFALPPVGLPFVALVVLPLIVFHLRAERRTRMRVRR